MDFPFFKLRTGLKGIGLYIAVYTNTTEWPLSENYGYTNCNTGHAAIRVQHKKVIVQCGILHLLLQLQWTKLSVLQTSKGKINLVSHEVYPQKTFMNHHQSNKALELKGGGWTLTNKSSSVVTKRDSPFQFILTTFYTVLIIYFYCFFCFCFFFGYFYIVYIFIMFNFVLI